MLPMGEPTHLGSGGTEIPAQAAWHRGELLSLMCPVVLPEVGVRGGGSDHFGMRFGL